MKRALIFAADLGDGLAGTRELLNVRSLVFEAAFAQDIQHRIVKEGPFDDPMRGKPLEGRKVTAPEEISQVGCEIDWVIVSNVHPSVLG